MDNGSYNINSKLVFKPPQYDKKTLHHIYNSNNVLVEKLSNNIALTNNEKLDLEHLPDTYLICYFNGFEEAREQMERARSLLKETDKKMYQSLKESLRILRKVKYS